MKRLIFDLDDTLCTTYKGDYRNSEPRWEVIEKLKHYHAQGFEIVISTSRNVRTYEGNVGKINANTLPLVIEWLERHDIPYDEIYMAKPWCGFDGFYIDDKAIRPSEFLEKDYEELKALIDGEKCF
ncbi:HAD-IIIC family phosphatase [Thiomicrorhabdus sp. zzn3]|uniref:HAD-IIIC family phosphatase n=1 Tax=Thiomicrorhabdus sp. zzn3 TaxID=3039775 RepID=UPI002436BBB5|nr:HAD-IIIC family phosphatase [Thiomicrorhabdus sp. zzn3]MDG6777381.1 HAD-IIIC family phosphatase [Thiomicrorhabdus sp. zzn3]